MADTFPAIKANFRRYRILLCACKATTADPLLTSPREKGPPVESVKNKIFHPHPRPYKWIGFEVIIKTWNLANYELKLFCEEFDEGRPVFRFESMGNGHMNPHDGKSTLAERRIPTPHFHWVGSDGRMLAFRTRFLNDPEQEKHVLAHYSAGVKHFCQEVNLRTPSGADVDVQMASNTLPLSTSKDPLEGVTF